MIINELKRCIRNNEKSILATIIDKKGSSYRQVGAKSLILTDGTLFGVLSGGCIEEDLFEHAKEVFETGEPKKIVYDLRNDDQTPWGLGVGCNGIITIWLCLIDPVHKKREAGRILEVLCRQHTSAVPFTIGSVITSNNHDVIYPGYILDEKELESAQPFDSINGLLENQTMMIDGKIIKGTIYLETNTPIPNVIVFGAGPDASSLASQLKFLHWHVTVVDHRPGYLNKVNFSNVDEMKLVAPRDFPSELNINDNSFVIVMTHHYEQDLAYLKGLTQLNPAYIGLLGPKRRFENLKRDLRAEGINIPKFIEDKIFTPVGLDIGAETPEEIALSIAAEIMSYKNKTTRQSLKWKNGSIHSSVSTNDGCKIMHSV